MVHSSADKWNAIYAGDGHKSIRAADVLEENQHLLPVNGTALDLACGMGGNALLLAQHGLQTYAWDISKTAIDKLRSCSENKNISLQLETRDLVALPPAPGSFDVIVVSRFLERSLIPHLITALREHGLIFYQTFIKDNASDTGPGNPKYRLEQNELLMLFQPLQIILYKEEGTLGDLESGFRNEAMIIARKNNSNV
jgi:SAM-dependent methyltransferase